MILTVMRRPPLLAAVLAAAAPVAAACGWIESEGRERIESRYRPGEALLSEPAANCFGRESKGSAQIRGNGPLVLTAEHLWFSLLVPADELTVPLIDVLDVDIVDAHLGKSVGRPLLRVRFRGSNGDDAAAWLVADPERWRREITARIPRAHEPGATPLAPGE